MATLVIKGHATRGKEVIKILEMLGGENPYAISTAVEGLLYRISNYDNRIVACSPTDTFVVFTLEEFLEKFPYKVGDKVSSKYLKNYKIEKMEWEDTNNRVIYKLQGMGWYSAEELQPYKEEVIVNNIIDTVKESDDRYRIVLNHQFDMEVDEGEYYAVRRKPKYPNTYEECFNICFGNKHHIVQVVGLDGLGDNKELFESFIKLKICRDAYWKIADDWEPNWEDNTYKYAIEYIKNHIEVDFRWNSNTTLSFPTEEMRDAFYENFKELIEECKELL